MLHEGAQPKATCQRFTLALLTIPCLILAMPKTVKPQPRTPDHQSEMLKVREYVDRMIQRGEAKEFLVKHGFVTPSGKLTKRYGG